MRVSHDTHPHLDLLYFSTGTPDVGGSDMFTAPGVVVFVGTEDGHDVVGIEIIGGPHICHWARRDATPRLTL